MVQCRLPLARCRIYAIYVGGTYFIAALAAINPAVKESSSLGIVVLVIGTDWEDAWASVVAAVGDLVGRAHCPGEERSDLRTASEHRAQRRAACWDDVRRTQTVAVWEHDEDARWSAADTARRIQRRSGWFLSFLPRDALLSAVYAVVVCLSVCVCVCVSVTLRYCIKTAKRRITQITPHDSPLTLVQWCCYWMVKCLYWTLNFWLV